MTAASAAPEVLPQRRANPRLRWFAIIATLLAIFVGANAHLVYVAMQSQPECVVHDGGDAASVTALRPAKPAC